jgi:hypothetical protein
MFNLLNVRLSAVNIWYTIWCRRSNLAWNELIWRGLAPEPEFVNLFRTPGIDSQPGSPPVRQPYLTNRPARLHGIAESIPWNRFLGYLNVYKFGLSNNPFDYEDTQRGPPGSKEMNCFSRDWTPQWL